MSSSFSSKQIIFLLIAGCLTLVTLSCREEPEVDQADMLLINGRVYTFNWDGPSPGGEPAANAPHSGSGWRPDADAIAIRGERIIFVGNSADATNYRGDRTRVIDLKGATVIPARRGIASFLVRLRTGRLPAGGGRLTHQISPCRILGISYFQSEKSSRTRRSAAIAVPVCAR